MQYFIIFGAGESGRKALHYIGYNRVAFFVDSRKTGYIDEKKILHVDELDCVDRDEFILVIASEKYHMEMVELIEKKGISCYFVFREYVVWRQYEVLPYFWLNAKQFFLSYTSILGLTEINMYKKIAIIGNNIFLPYLISEIAVISDISNIMCIIPSEKCNESTYMGITLEHNTEVLKEADCIVVNVRRHNNIWVNVLDDLEKNIIDIYDVDRKLPFYKHPELLDLKDKYKGKRIFLVGNGPSINIKDLDTLCKNNEICIAFNKIYRIFGKTDWRPQYIGMTDPVMIEQIQHEIEALDIKLIIGDRYNQEAKFVRNIKNALYVHLIDEEFFPNAPRFSNDIVEGVYMGLSSVYDIGIQVAMYMGASEIYLIGVDNSIQGKVTDKCNHFIEDYYTEDELKRWGEKVPYTFDKTVLGYEVADKLSKERGVKIYNATRGGNLEVFERVNFDDLFINECVR